MKKTHKHKILSFKNTFSLVFTLIILTLISYFAFELIYLDKVYPGVKIGENNLGGKSLEQTEEYISQKTQKIDSEGIVFIYKEKETTIRPTVSSFEMDLAYPLIIFKPNETAQKVFSYGREGNFWKKLQEKIRALRGKQNLNLEYELEKEKIKETLKNRYEELEIPAQDAQLTIENKEEEINFSITPETIGKTINYKKASEDLKYNLNNLNNKNIKLKDETDYPEIYRDEVLTAKFQAESLITLAPISLFYNDKEWIVEKNTFANWLTLKSNSQEEYKITLKEKEIIDFIENNITDTVNKEPRKANFEIENNKVTEFQIPENGQELKMEETLEKLKNEIIKEKNEKVELAVETIKYEQNKKDLGIKTVIGTGHSNFYGSPYNRIQNIKTGAEKLNGLLIKPGEEFSLVESIGKVNRQTGYLPELVIKENETIPEYGGGLCQIATTVFRTILDTGLPITERRSHSYRVSYYEPAGTDATMYIPKPDLRFVNDTPGHIMIQSRIENTYDLYFDFWGTDDSRIATTTDPVIYNITNPGPTKYIETTELEPGEEKCTESAHRGADAYFDYKVIYPESSTTTEEDLIKERRFSSHYVPWREVCMIGKKTATSTSETTEEEPEN